MNPHAIFIFSAGIMPRDDGTWRSTTYEESDAFGILGGRDRVEAATVLSEQYPDAYIVTTCKHPDPAFPSQAKVYAEELQALGVSPERIILEEVSINTGTSVDNVLQLAREREWSHVLVISSGYQVPRIKAFFEGILSEVKVKVVGSEAVLIEHGIISSAYVDKLQQSPEYKKRVASEERGIEALRAGKYKPAPYELKKER